MSWRWLCSETRDSARALRVAILGDGGFEGFALESAKETISRPWMSRAVQFEEDFVQKRPPEYMLVCLLAHWV
jgi:hypothetical protein